MKKVVHIKKIGDNLVNRLSFNNSELMVENSKNVLQGEW